MKALRILLWTTLGIVVAGYVGVSVFFMSHFVVGSTINGTDVSYLDRDGSVAKVNAAVDKYSLTVTGLNGKSDVLSVADLGLVSNVDGSEVDYLLRHQNGFIWPYYIFKPVAYSLDNGITCSKDQVRVLINSLSSTKSTGKRAEDAKLEFRNGAFVITKEKFGDTILVNETVEAIMTAAEGLVPELNLEEAGCYEVPTILSDNEKLITGQENANHFVKPSFVYVIGSSEEEITAETKASWLKIDDDYNVTLDEEMVAEFVDTMCNRYNTVGVAKKLYSSTLDDYVMVPAGWYGWKIDRDAEVEQLLADLNAGENVARDFIYAQTAASHDGNDYGDFFLEVDISAQHVYVHKNGAIVFDTDCVTGDIYNGCDTHDGAYSIYGKDVNRVLRGPGYETPVNYWMPFHYGEGLHDATWRNAFGGNIYMGNGSHGCVNLPLSAAATIYEMVRIGTPVLVYFSANYR